MFLLLIKLMILDVVNFSILFFIYWEINNLLKICRFKFVCICNNNCIFLYKLFFNLNKNIKVI